MNIESEKFYRPQDQELRQIASVQTLAKWRCEGRGPKYYTISRILYKGQDILNWLELHSVRPRQAA